MEREIALIWLIVLVGLGLSWVIIYVHDHILKRGIDYKGEMKQ